MAASGLPSWSRPLACLLALALCLPACQRAADTQALLDEARQYRHQGDHAAAIIQLKNALVLDDKHAEARRLLGEVYLEQGDAVSAEKELQRARELGAPAAQVAPLLARAYLMQQQFDRVLAATEAGGPPLILALRGEALLGKKLRAEARASHEAALARDPACVPALLGLARLAAAEHPADAHALVARALLASPFDPDSLRLQGDLLRLAGKPEAALQAYKKILAMRPNHPQALVDIANLHTDAGNFAQARQDIAQARRASPGAVAVYHAQALLDFREGKYNAAFDTVQQVLAAVPGHMPTVLLAGAIASALGANEQAARHFQAFLDSYPAHPYALKSLAVLALREQQPARAIALLDPLMRERSDDIELLTLAGEARLRARRFDEAAAMFEAAAALRPDLAMLHAGAALGHFGQGDSDRAIANLERAASLDRSAQRTGLMLVMARLRANQPGKALAAVQDMEGQGDSALVQNLKGGVLLALQERGKARAAFERALALDTAYLPALDNLARLDLLAQRPADARQRYEAALARDAGNTALMAAYARQLLAQGRTSEAIAWLEKAHHRTPDARPVALRLAGLYSQTGHADKALALARQLQTGQPDDPALLAIVAQAQHGSGALPAAAASYAQLARLEPGNALAPLRLAHVQLQQNERPAAMASLRRALAIDPDLFEAQITLVNLLSSGRHYAEAQLLAKQAQQRHPDRAAGYKLEGDVLAAQDKTGLALAAYEQAFRLAPAGPALVQVHQALQRLGRASEADTRLRQWCEQHRADVPTRLYLASSTLVAGDVPAAIAHFEAVLAHDPANVIALNDLAWAHQRSGSRKALGYAERAWRLAPANAAVMDTLAWILVEQGNIARALPLLQQASAAAPQAAEIGYHYGAALARAGDKTAARRELQRVLALGQDFAGRAAARTLLQGL